MLQKTVLAILWFVFTECGSTCASSYKEPLHRIKNRSVGMFMKPGKPRFRFRMILKSDYPFGNTRIDLMRTNIQISERARVIGTTASAILL